MQARGSQPRTPWYRVPVAWLGVLVFAASMAGCVWIIVASVQYRDEPVQAGSHSVMGVPARAHPVPASS
jgi:hypothetical protein